MADALPDKVSRTLYRGDSRTWTHVFTDAATGGALDLTGYTFVSQYRNDLDRGTVICSATCTVGGASNNEVTEVLSAADAALLPGQTDPAEKPVVYWDLQSTDASGNVRTWMYAAVKVLGDVSDA
jgi:hypothetical protein